MRTLAVFLVSMLCASCALKPFEIQSAPLKTDQAVVFDIDGTLTPSKFAIYSARDNAADAVRLYADRGYKIIYLSARFPLFQAGIPDWLKKNHFPEGSIHVPKPEDYRSDDGYAEAFKRGVLSDYGRKNWKFVAAYGDQCSDFNAYQDVGIDAEHVFALRRSGEAECEKNCKTGQYKACLASWTEHLGTIRQLARP